MTPEKSCLQPPTKAGGKRFGRELTPPMQQIPANSEQAFWLRNLLPEFFWIDALIQEYGESEASEIFNDFLAAADRFNPHPSAILDGTVSAFMLIPEGRRQAFTEELREEIDLAVSRPFGHVLLLFPKCPISWMAPAPSVDRNASIAKVRESVLRLFRGDDLYAGTCRALPLGRLLAHRKTQIPSALEETIEAIRTYPRTDRFIAEAYVQSIHAATLRQLAEDGPNTFAWGTSFWNADLSIAPFSIV